MRCIQDPAVRREPRLLTLTAQQIDGYACCVCGASIYDVPAMTPVSRLGDHQLVRCWPDCDAL
jgi:hypothetical protein